MEYKCSVCGKPLSRAMSVSNNYVSKTTDMICMSCMKEIDPIAYLFVLESIERQLKLINKQRKKSTEDNKYYNNKNCVNNVCETNSTYKQKTAS
ncbi:MAG: hypothetical protein ACOCV8_05350 [Spirochaetota bacterium]